MELNKVSEILVSDKQALQRWILKEAGIQTEQLHFERQGSFLWSNSVSKNTTMILFRTQADGVVVKQKKENGYLAAPLCKTKSENIADSVCISPNGYKGNLLKHKENNHFFMLKSTDAFLPGERLLIQPECKCKGEKLYGWQASSIAILRLAISLIKACKLTQNPITIAFVNETLAGEEETLHLIANQNPKQIVVCSTAAERELFSAGGGPALVIKDGNGVITPNFRQEMEEAAQGCGLTLSYFIGNEDSTFASMYLAARNNFYGGFYLPVKEKNSSIEEINLKDVEKTQTLLLKYLASFAIINK